MKKHKFILPLLAIAFTAFVISGCNKDDEDDNNNTPGETENVIKGEAKDAISYEVLSDATIKLMETDGSLVAESQVNQNGDFEFKDIANGTYNLEVTASGYKSMMAKNIKFEAAKATSYPKYAAFLTVEESVTQPVAAVSGIVLDMDYLPISNAVVSISAQDESLTNGYFSNSLSTSQGFFVIGAIPLNSSNTGQPIPSFKVRAIKGGYNTVVHTDIVLAENELSIMLFQLSEQSASGNTIWEETFEEESQWDMRGFWHRQMNASIFNTAYPEYVKLAPNDETEGKIPDAYAGQYFAWYGEVETGNFLGEPEEGQDSLSGGTSVDENMGSMISPVIDLSSYNEASLSFWTWYEIESVNPNEYGYDIMEIKVINTSDTTDVTSIGRLNPFSDPILDDRAALPYSSGGFNKAPIWTFQALDLTDFAGMEIMLEFNFRTVDGLYNGFRGWIVDNIKVTDEGLETKSSQIKEYPADPKPRR